VSLQKQVAGDQVLQLQFVDCSERQQLPAPAEVASTVDLTQNVYNKTWWEERVEAVSMAAATVWREFIPTPQSA
jgi:hypothetical protein